MEWVRRLLLRVLPQEGSKVAQVKKSILPSYGVYELQGRRPYMEDTHICVPCLASHVESQTIPKDVRLFAVFDGHGGKVTSTYASHHFPAILAEHMTGSHPAKTLEQQEVVSDILVTTLKETHSRLRRDHPDKHPMDGCTAVVCLEYEGRLWTANLGDSRAVLCRNGRTIALTDDHSPMRPDEFNRIHNAGGFVHQQGVYDCPRVYWADGRGGLALSRALGDDFYQRGDVDLVPVDPEVTFEKLEADDQFILLFTDGLLEPFSSEEIVSAAHSLTNNSTCTPLQVAQALVISAFEEGSTDNLTCVYWNINPKE